MIYKYFEILEKPRDVRGKKYKLIMTIYGLLFGLRDMEIFIEWIKELVKEKTGKMISIDGKVVKSATDKINGENTPYIVSTFIGELGLSMGQVKVDDKSNEITAIPDLLALLDTKGAIVTIDAIGTQEDIFNKIDINKAEEVVETIGV